MPKKKEEAPDFSTLSESEKKARVNAAVSKLMAKNPTYCMLDNAISNIEGFEDTGSYTLNALLSGDLRGGFPEGRLSILAAPSSVGKSYIALQTAAIAQQKGKTVVIYDSETALDRSFAASMGLDTSKVVYNTIKSIEQCKADLFDILSVIRDEKLYGQFIIIVDSLGAMISEADYKRADEGSTTQAIDGGAKAMKAFVKMLNNMSSNSRTTVICTNHIYENPGALYKTIEKPMSGGLIVRYLPSTICQLSASKVKEEDNSVNDTASTSSKGITGINITGLSVKNRVCKPYITAEMMISWERGFMKYYGLLDLAKAFGLIVSKGGRYYVKETEEFIGYLADANENAEFWERYMPTLQEAINKDWRYKSTREKREVENREARGLQEAEKD